jgi:hypothetical protein
MKSEAYPSVSVRGIDIPVFPTIKNYGLERFDAVSRAIDSSTTDDVEYEKVPILINELSYLNFIQSLSDTREVEIVSYLREFLEDDVFHAEISSGLLELNKINGAGDLRFHAISLYLLVRSIKPTWMIETGVAHGKSSAFVLCAMDHNKKGNLISIDLPPPVDRPLSDGARTTMQGRQTGWLVPERLRSRWSLTLGDSLAALPKAVERTAPEGVDVFLHDSLHTYEHAASEFDIVDAVASNLRRKPVLFLCDNIDMGCGFAFNDFITRHHAVGYGYRDFAGAMF